MAHLGTHKEKRSFDGNSSKHKRPNARYNQLKYLIDKEVFAIHEYKMQPSQDSLRIIKNVFNDGWKRVSIEPSIEPLIVNNYNFKFTTQLGDTIYIHYQQQEWGYDEILIWIE